MSFQIINPTIDIIMFAAILGAVSIIVQIKFLNWKKTRQLQRSIQEKNKKAMELMKKGDEHSKKEAEELQKQVMADMGEQFKNLPKQMIISLIIFLPPFTLIRIYYGDSGYLVHLPWDIPLLGAKWGWLKLYFVSGAIISLALNFIIGKLEEKGMI